MYNNVPLDESGLTTTVGVVQAYLSTAESCDATRGRSKPRRDAYLYLNGFRPYISGSTLPHIYNSFGYNCLPTTPAVMLSPAVTMAAEVHCLAATAVQKLGSRWRPGRWQ